ncbi:PaaI family thioesterase [Desulfatiglans anilini]|uniref:PaaI family thioesterase n=1 Tax=Desulfatiglans anilini TaxID=90728 RepID=UPI000414B2F6|nr:PaaI family thioesterase [Desulfatiglans anilini]
MRRLNPDHVQTLAERVNTCPFFELMSMQLDSFDAGASRLEIALKEKHLQPYGIVHGGVTAAIVDAAAFWAVYACVEEGVGLTTVDIKVNYLAPISAGKMIGRGRCIKAGRTICLADAAIETPEGLLIAHGTATMMVLSSMKLAGQETLPPKFIDE